jgi:hypothetical protein
MPRPPKNGDIRLLGKTVANVISAYEGACIGVCNCYSFSVDDKPIIGLALTLQPRSEAIVKVLFRRQTVIPKVGDWLNVKLNT